MLLSPRARVAYLCSTPQRTSHLGIESKYINPQPVLDYCIFTAPKTDYELACMREAQKSVE
ncbi:MAG: Xaa-Pro dipeptidase [Sodalis sp.]|nr:MAG: Xaa-Pro dipeptidase [Sodalis sp.]